MTSSSMEPKAMESLTFLPPSFVIWLLRENELYISLIVGGIIKESYGDFYICRGVYGGYKTMEEWNMCRKYVTPCIPYSAFGSIGYHDLVGHWYFYDESLEETIHA